jgi:hypothetical protein
MYEIKTGNYLKQRKILIDGNEWTMTAPGAGDELALGQARRRVELIQKKVDGGTAVEADYDMYDRLEDKMFNTFSRMFKDTTEDNSQVTSWLNATPMVVIYAIMEDIKKQVESSESEAEVS